MRNREFKNPRRLSILIEDDFHKHLQSQAMEMSRLEGKQLTICEMVRRGLEASFPTSKQEMLSL